MLGHCTLNTPVPRLLQQLLGYSSHPPFMGHVNGTHPNRVLRDFSPMRTLKEFQQ